MSIYPLFIVRVREKFVDKRKITFQVLCVGVYVHVCVDRLLCSRGAERTMAAIVAGTLLSQPDLTFVPSVVEKKNQSAD